ncbi:MAG: hypothetical protein V2A55_02020 [Candidatus Jorgensenbacteria bacterium]
MKNEELSRYVKDQLEKGTSPDEIKNALRSAGWREEYIASAFPGGGALGHFPGAFETMGQAWKIYKERFFTLLGVFFISLIIPIALSFITSSKLFVGMGSGMSQLLILLVVSLAIGIIFWLVFSWGQASLIYAVKDHAEKIGILESFRRGRSKILPYFWVYILLSLIITGGFLLFLVPGVIFAVWTLLAPFVLVAENDRGLKALVKSREYVRGHWWGVFWRFLFILIVLLIPSLGISFIVSLATPDIVSQIVNFIVSLLIGSLGVVYSFQVYKNLKDFKGEVVIAPRNKTRKVFIVFAVLAPILLLLALVFVFLSSSLSGLLFLKAVENNQTPSEVFNFSDTSLPGDQGSGQFDINILYPSESETKTAQETADDSRKVSDAMFVLFTLGRFYEENGRFPAVLEELTPKYISSIPASIDVYNSENCPSPGADFVLRTLLSDRSNPALLADHDGALCGIDCNDDIGAYCATR